MSTYLDYTPRSTRRGIKPLMGRKLGLTEASAIFFKSLIRGNYPVLALCLLTLSVINIVSSFFAGRFIGSTAIAVIGLFAPIEFIIQAALVLSWNGFQVSCCTALGKGDEDEASNIFTKAMLFSLNFGALFSLVGVFFNDSIAVALGASDDMLAQTRMYILGMGMLGIFRFTQAALLGFANISADKRWSTISSIAMIIANIVANILLVLVFPIGILGIALANGLSMLVGSAVLLFHFGSDGTRIRFSLKLLNWKNTKQSLLTGFSAAIRRVADLIRSYGTNAMLLFLAGSSALAASSVGASWISILFIMISGISSLMQILPAIFYGERNAFGLKSVLKIACCSALAWALFGTLISFLFAREICELFLKGSEPEILQMTITYIQIIGIGIIPHSVLSVYQKYLNGVSRNSYSVFSTMSAPVIQLVLSVVLSVPFGVTGVWLAYPVSCAVCIVLTLVVCKVATGSVYCLPKNFEIEKGKYREVFVRHDKEEILWAEKTIEAFCNENDIDVETRNTLVTFTAQTVEAIMDRGTELIPKRYKKRMPKQSKAAVDIWIARDEDGILLRIRDNFPPCDFESFYDHIYSEHFAAKRPVLSETIKSLDDIQYLSIMQTNNFIAKIKIDDQGRRVQER